jgi:hypothetical protein
VKIVILDGYTENPGDLSWAGFEKLGGLTVYDYTPPELIRERVADAEAVYTNKTPLSREVIQQAGSCATLVCWQQGTTLWMWPLPGNAEFPFAIFPPMARRRWRSLCLRCF